MTRLMARARYLGARVNTEWAYENANKYKEFEEELESLYNKGLLTGHDYNELGLVAFYDFEMKEEEEEQ